jgi:hypothetical protein
MHLHAKAIAEDKKQGCKEGIGSYSNEKQDMLQMHKRLLKSVSRRKMQPSR